MTIVTFRDIVVLARQESDRMRHHYLGVEHIFIALLEISGGLASISLHDYGLAPDYVVDAIRRRTGKGSKHILWAGMPNTPRLDVVLSIAQDLALDAGREQIEERDVLLAIIDENDNIPVRVLASLGVDLQLLRSQIDSGSLRSESNSAFLKIDFSDSFAGSLDRDDIYLIRRLFIDYTNIAILCQLPVQTPDTRLMVINASSAEDNHTGIYVIKVAPQDNILDELQHYEKYNAIGLPLFSARIDRHPSTYTDSTYAAIRYQISESPAAASWDLVINRWQTHYEEELGAWLARHLLTSNWWVHTSQYEFEAWYEYDWMLPPILSIQYRELEHVPSEAHILRFPIHRSRLSNLRFGDTVLIENFTVQQVDFSSGSITLALGQGTHTTRPYQIQVSGIDLNQNTFFRGEVVDRLLGTVWKTREEILQDAVAALDPDFPIDMDTIHINRVRYPNPVQAYQWLLGVKVTGKRGVIHGNLQTSNMLIGSDDNFRLIDYAKVREGHILFDWAYLSSDLFNLFVASRIPNNWGAIYSIINSLDAASINPSTPVMQALHSIRTVYHVIDKLLANADDPREFHVALVFTALSAVCNPHLPQAARRIQFLLAAYALKKYEDSKRS